MLEIKLDAELVIEKLFLITIFLIFICVIYRVSCETIPEEIFDMRTTSPSLENTGDHPTALRPQRSYLGANYSNYVGRSINLVNLYE